MSIGWGIRAAGRYRRKCFLGARESARSRERAFMRHDDPARICPRCCQISCPGRRADPDTAAGLRAAATTAVGPQWETFR
jgi:hypothetical protein